MNSENDHDYFRCTLEAETKSAFCVRLTHNSATHWVPKALCEIKSNSREAGPVLEVEAWFAKKEGMHG